jgi:exopolyphosphatase/guanosine-5'-triphosphate,3'-diphosphate pyrophosphatase
MEMPVKQETRQVAAIDVGSNYLSMTVAEVKVDGRVRVIEDLIKPTNIGRDTFAEGRVAVETIHETCLALKGFAQLIKDYRIKKHYKAVSTSGIRETENREYVLDQIRLQTGLDVEVINSAQERFLTYKALRNYLQGDDLIKSQPTLIVSIRSGGVEISIYDAGSLKFTEYIKLGSLRLRELLADLEAMTIDFPGVMEEYIESKIYLLKSTIKKLNIKQFVGLGGEELHNIYRLCGGEGSQDGSYFISRDMLTGLYKKMRDMNNDQIMNAYDVSRKEADTLLPSLILLHSFIKMTEAQGLSAPRISLRQGLIYDLADNLFSTPGRKESLDDIISSVWYIAEKYGVDRKHASCVEQTALAIFDQTWKLHRLDERERLYLQVAAILHDTGNYVSFSDHELHSYNNIRVCNIMGLSDSELNLIANIARYHAEEIPSHNDDNYTAFRHKNRITISKLAAILKLAESLDISHRQKIKQVEVQFSQDRAIFNLYTSQDTLLEEWDFMNHAEFFEEVMGIQPIVKRKRAI